MRKKRKRRRRNTQSIEKSLLRILLIEDNPDDTKLIRRLLAPSAEFRLTAKNLLSQGLECFEKESFDVLLLDLSLPDSSGLENLHRVLARTTRVPTIVLTDGESEETVVWALRKGAQDYLVKGKIDEDKLRRAIFNSMERHQLEARLAQRADELLKSEIKFRGLVEANADPVLIVDTKGVMRFANSAAEALFDRTREELTGKPFGLPLTTGKTMEIEIPARDGGTFVAEIHLAETKWEEEPVSLVSLRDITQRKQAESQLRASEEKFRGLLEAAPDAMIIASEHGQILMINAQAEKMFGYDRRELVGKPVEVLIPEAVRDAHIKHRTKYLADPRTRPMGIGFSYDLTGRRRDGSTIPLDIALSPLQTPEGLIVTTALRDITERKRIEAEIRHSLERTRALYEIDKAITSTLDLQSILDLLLEKTDQLLPYPIALAVRLLNKKTNDLEPLAARNIDLEEWKEIVQSSQHHEQSFGRTAMKTMAPVVIGEIQRDPRTQNPEFYRKEGIVSSLAIPLIAKDEVLGVLSVYIKAEHEVGTGEIDFLSALAGQAAVAIYNAELYSEMTKLAGNLTMANRVKSEFLSVMSHELRTPLNVVMNYTEILMDGMLGEISPEQQNALKKILTQSKDQLAMVNQILQTNQLEVGGEKIQIHEVALTELLEGLKSAYEQSVSKDLSLIWDYPSDLPLMQTDGGKLKQILQNLINNAIKFTPKGHVAISARHDPASETVELKIEDTGTGIAKEFLPTIFEMFRQADSSETRLYGGVGLGLYIVKQYVEAMGGTVAAESEVGRGSTFIVRLPLQA